MIVQCPECDTRFNVDDALLLPDGRKVRCTQCKHVWFQEPPQESEAGESEAQAAEKQDAENDSQSSSFAAAVDEMAQAEESAPSEPYNDDDDEFSGRRKRSFISRLKKNIYGLLGAGKEKAENLNAMMYRRKFIKFISFVLGAVFCFFICISAFVGLKDFITLRAPSFYNVYNDLGYQITPAGQDLIIKKTDAVWQHDEQGEPFLTIKGEIFNNADSPRRIPPLKVTLLLKSGAKGDSFVETLDKVIIEGRATDSFSLRVPNWPETANDVLLSFDIESLN